MKNPETTLEQLNAIVDELERTTPALVARIKMEAREAGCNSVREYLQFCAKVRQFLIKESSRKKRKKKP